MTTIKRSFLWLSDPGNSAEFWSGRFPAGSVLEQFSIFASAQPSASSVLKTLELRENREAEGDVVCENVFFLPADGFQVMPVRLFAPIHVASHVYFSLVNYSDSISFTIVLSVREPWRSRARERTVASGSGLGKYQ